MGRDAIVGGFWDSIEFRQKRVRVTYNQVLSRDPDPGGLAYWAQQLLSFDEVRLAAFLAASQEFWVANGGGVWPPPVTRSQCHPAYDGCIPPPPPDLDCPQIGRIVRVDNAHGDPHDLDADGDGIGCESYG